MDVLFQTQMTRSPAEILVTAGKNKRALPLATPTVTSRPDALIMAKKLANDAAKTVRKTLFGFKIAFIYT